jgi:hypothetical protein
MYWVTGLGIGLLLIGAIFIASGQITIFENQELNENCDISYPDVCIA